MTRRKLVRDHIPEIAAAAGNVARFEQAEPAHRIRYLLAKLVEEANEVHAEPSLDELADVLEVLHALGDTLGHTWDEVETVRLEKRAARGAFDRGVVLIIEENNP